MNIINRLSSSLPPPPYNKIPLCTISPDASLHLLGLSGECKAPKQLSMVAFEFDSVIGIPAQNSVEISEVSSGACHKSTRSHHCRHQGFIPKCALSGYAHYLGARSAFLSPSFYLKTHLPMGIKASVYEGWRRHKHLAPSSSGPPIVRKKI